jgi:zinc protease
MVHALFAIALVLGVPGLAASAPSLPVGVVKVTSVEGIDEYRLRNGLQVLLVKDDSKPTVTVNMTYQVGSRHENYGETGMAHLLEHLLFKGSPKYPQVWGEFTKRGMRANGSTWTDRTNYFASFAANEANLDWYLRWCADGMVNSYIAKKDLDTEMTVVRNEMEMGENNPISQTMDRVASAAYSWHNYGKSTIGARADVENVDIGRLKAFYRLYYQPDNATLVVSGKFDEDKTLKVIDGAFGKIPKPRRVLPRLYTVDPVQEGERQIIVRRSGGAPAVIAAYHMPPSSHPDGAAVELIEDIMGDTPTGRLYQSLVSTKLAAGVFSAGYRFRDPTLGFYAVQLAPAGAVEPARQALLKTLEGLSANPITNEELERIRGRWLKNWELSFSDPEQIGVSLSEAIALGDWRMFFLRRDQIRQISLAQVQRVAQERFVPDNRTVGIFEPTEKSVRAPIPALFDVATATKNYRGGAAAAKGEAFEATPENLEKRTQRLVIKPGVQLALVPKRTRGEVVTGNIFFGMGSLESLRGQATLASLMAAALDRGTDKLTRAQIQDQFDQMKAQVAFGGSPGAVVSSFTTTKPNLEKTLNLIFDVLRNATFPSEQIEQLKTESLTAIKNAEKEPESIISLALRRNGNPYPKEDVRYAETTEEAVSKIGAVTAQQIRAFHKKFLGAQYVQVSIVGDLEAKPLQELIDKNLAGWNASEPYARIPNPFVATKSGNLKFETPDKQNANMAVELSLALQDDDPDYPAMAMANFLFGGGQDSRLWTRIREKEGLSYGTWSSLNASPWEKNATWSAGALFAPQNLSKVRSAFNEELQRALAEGFSETEVKSGIKALLQRRSLNWAQDTAVSSTLGGFLRLNRSFADAAKLNQQISQLTATQVSQAFRKYIKPDQIVFAFAGDFARAGQ